MKLDFRRGTVYERWLFHGCFAQTGSSRSLSPPLAADCGGDRRSASASGAGHYYGDYEHVRGARHYYWDDGHVRINVSYTREAFVNGPANGGPALIREGKNYLLATSPQAAYDHCQTKTTSGFIFTRQCLSDARNQLINDQRALNRYLGPLTNCDASIGRRLLQVRHPLSVTFASAASFYAYSVAAGYAGHYFPHLIGPHLTIQIVAGLLALTVIAQHFISLAGNRSHPALPELLATIVSWFANSALVQAVSELRSQIGETVSAYFAQRHQARRVASNWRTWCRHRPLRSHIHQGGTQ